MEDIKIDEIISLKEQGWSLRQIETYIKENGNNISYETIRKRIDNYYVSIGRVKEKNEISDEELVKLKEQKNTDREIAEKLAMQGKMISITSVNRRLNNYYKSIGEQKPKVVSDEEVALLKEAGMRDVDIVEYFTRTGRKISLNGVVGKLKRYYKLIGKERPRVKTRIRKSKKEQTEIESKDLREEFKEKIKVDISKEESTTENLSSKNVVNYSRKDEER